MNESHGNDSLTNGGAVLIGILLILAAAIFINIGKCIVRARSKERKLFNRNDHLLTFSIASSYILSVLCLLSVLGNIDTQWDLSIDVPVLLQAAFTLPSLGLVLTVWLAINVVLDWIKRRTPWLRTTAASIFTVASFSYLFILHYYRFIGFYY
ncbi:hypothetical protein QJQ58_04330 [Paenibacillus dendritiformis]|uniref:hypothetical protein n=1 Tax=Paenibacillus dendritiformis TaxID=130049 RepID=UPI00248BC090|nr:hypothetical protein [Paenibacillus dendritiformis]WGU95503.1 hypothetical protein QJQ58_04330 [Paenibacillus dendritiformis]